MKMFKRQLKMFIFVLRGRGNMPFKIVQNTSYSEKSDSKIAVAGNYELSIFIQRNFCQAATQKE